MLKILLVFFIVIYIGSIISNIGKNLRMKKCMQVLSAFLDSGKLSSYGILTKNENFYECLENLLQQYPVICEFRDFYDPSLSYEKDLAETYEAAAKLYRNFLMTQNFLINDFFNSLNPINTLRKAITFPSAVLKFFGLTLNTYASRFFNLIGWLAAYVLGMYQNEIKAFLTTLIKHF